MGNAVGYGTFRDMGTAPLSFNGLLFQPTLGLHLIYPKRMEFSFVSRSSLGIFEDAVAPALNFGSFDINFYSRLMFMKAVKGKAASSQAKAKVLQFYWGAALASFLDVTVNTEYENSATGVSYFIGPEAVGRVDIMPRWKAPLMFHAELGLLPVAAVMRPGYSYIDNYTATHPVLDALFSDFDVSLKGFAGADTDIGIDLVTGPASRVSLCYLWSFHTSGNSGYHRFDHATHILAIDLLVRLHTADKR